MATIVQPVEQVTQRVILPHVCWETYERLLADHQESSGIHFTYDQGRLEILVPSLRHEKLKHTLATLVELLAGTLNIDIEGAGSTTFRRQDLARGFEPDACFYVAHAARMRQREDIDLTVDPPPDLVIEVDITSPSLNKMPIFAALGVPEVWRYDGRQVSIFVLGAGEYTLVEGSAAFPGVTPEVISQFVEAGKTLQRMDWQRSVRDWAYNRRAHPPAAPQGDDR
jgi:Uma2 family endonuclease